ncbi:radical SAM protein [Candidatus Woesearchaeota archaeon]|nr:radical SAM protein [Candidatus Woesearchaeota archaeon]
MKKAAIITGYACNNNCAFCYDSEKREQGIADLSTADVIERIRFARERGCEYLDFLGGEFTIRKDALYLVSYAKKLGFKIISVTTNGRAFSYMQLLQRFIDSGVNSIVFSIHGHTDELHDMQTMVKGSFRQAKKAVANAKKLNIPISTNTTITRLNLNELPEIGRFLYDLGSRNAEFVFLDPTTGRGNTDFERLMPGIKESAGPIKKLLDIGIQHRIGHWHIRYYPMCYIKGYEDRVSEYDEKKSFELDMHLGPEFINMDAQGSRKDIGKIKPESCRMCVFDNMCEGVWKRYAEIRGTEELVPVSGDIIKK